VLVEFDGDQDALGALTECLQKDPARFAHVAQRLRDDREEARLRTEATARLAEDGVSVVEEPNTYGGPVRALRELRATEKTQLGTRLTVKRHAKCPGHAAYLDYSSRRPVEERIEVVYVCTDFRERQHPLLWHSNLADSDVGQRGGKMTEEQKAERRTVIRNGKAWDSATTVRRDWLREFAARRTPPKGAAVWMAQMWGQGSPALRTAMEQDHPLAMDLLGLAPKDGRSRFNRGLTHPIADAAATATPGRATLLSLVMLLAAIEESTDRRHTWDSPSREQIAYFTQLDAWGYPLEEVEKLVLARATPAVATTPQDPALPDAASGDATDPGTEPSADAATDPPADLIDVDEAPVYEPMALVA
jgi:ParB family transcriptional regulator, chromosome partitioning protein